MGAKTVSTATTLALTLLITTAAAADQGKSGQSGGETPWRWIGLMKEAKKGEDPGGEAERRESKRRKTYTCPAPAGKTGWVTTPLFANTENRALQRFCLYSRDQAGDPQPLHNLGLECLDPDVMGLTSQASDLATETWQALQSHFLSQVGQVALPPGPAAAVRLAVVDASPTGTAVGADGPEDVAANSPHGTALLNMARDLLCDGSELSCRATVASRLALAYECLDPVQPRACRNGQEGGYIGLIGELAQAVHREVVVWQQRPDEQRLVLNLSLGWHTRLGGGEANLSAMPTPVQAVYRAIEDAVCRGALVMAAAGNRDAAATRQSGPFLPALWETRDVPTMNDCRQLGLQPAPGLDGPVSYRPLVFSAAAVEASGEPLDTTRRDGVARLAAFGDHAVVTFSNTTGPTGTLTGSSVAALAVAATAAAVWSYEINVSAFALMESIYLDSTSLGRNADYCLGGSPCPAHWADVRSVSMCQAVAAACIRSGACIAPSCAVAAPLDLSTVDLSTFDTVTEIDMEAIDEPLAAPLVCDGETVYYDAAGDPPADPCPHQQYAGPTFEPWAEPQPSTIPCPNCIGTYASPGTLYFEVDDGWGSALSSATLKCGTVTYALIPGPLDIGDQLRLTNVPETCLTAFPTFLSFTHGTDRAVISPVRLCQGCG